MKKSSDKKILFVYYSFSSFVKQDYEILLKHYTVEKFQWRGKKDLFRLAFKILKSDMTFSWFAYAHAAVAVFFSKIFRKKSIVVVGGGDVAYVPEIGYGAFTSVRHRVPANYVLKNADRLLAVSEFTKSEILQRSNPKNVEVIYNGVDLEKNMVSDFGKKENLVLTIGDVSKQRVKLKGLETFTKASVAFSKCQFAIIGNTDDLQAAVLKETNPGLIFTGRLPHDETLKWLARAKVYCQLSYRESFGVGLAEAMACGCAPVVTSRGALPEVVGDAGFYVPYGDEKATADAIRKAVEASGELGKKARERIKDNFPIEKREKRLISLISEMNI